MTCSNIRDKLVTGSDRVVVTPVGESAGKVGRLVE